VNRVLYAVEYFRGCLSYGAVFYAVTDFLDLICDRLFRFRERSRDGLFDCIEFFLDLIRWENKRLLVKREDLLNFYRK
jgi:hypothetical protein